MHTKKFELCHADTCLPDYWAGHHRPHVSISVSKGMKLDAIKSAIKSELAQGCVMGSDHNAFLLSADFVGAENDAEADEATRAAYEAVELMQPANKRRKNFFNDLRKTDLDVQAYFVFVEIN